MGATVARAGAGYIGGGRGALIDERKELALQRMRGEQALEQIGAKGISQRDLESLSQEGRVALANITQSGATGRQAMQGTQALEQLAAKGDINAASMLQAYQQNRGMLDATTQANLQLGGAQTDWQKQLNEQSAGLNRQNAAFQNTLNQQSMMFGAGLNEQAAQSTFGRNLAGQQFGADLSEKSAQSAFGRNLAMQQATHGLNQQTMQNQYNLGQQGAQAAQDRGFQGINRMNQMMFGGPGGGMFGQIQNAMGGLTGGQNAPQFGGSGSFGQTGAGQQIASTLGTNPYESAMGMMTGGPGAPPPGSGPQGPMGNTAQMIGNHAWANNAGQFAGYVAQQGFGANFDATQEMSGAGQRAGGMAATRNAPGLQAAAQMPAAAINAYGAAMGGVA